MQMMSALRQIGFSTLLVALMTSVLEAHPNHLYASPDTSHPGGFMTGFVHPLFGMDHLLALLTVGLLSSQFGRKGLWLGPLCFLSGVATGGLSGLGHNPVFGMEFLIALSVLMLGAALSIKKAPPSLLLYSSFIVFGFFHGYAHGTEVPSMANRMGYIGGFMTGSSLLILASLVVGIAITTSTRSTRSRPLRISGAGVALAGLFFLIHAV